jgi:hypothetical protein
MTALYYGITFAAWAACGYGFTALRQARRALKDAIGDQQFTDWANWTILSVTGNDGQIFSSTLRQLHRDHVTDEVWVSPIAAALWHADPNVHSDYVRQAEKIHGAAHIDEKDQTT